MIHIRIIPNPLTLEGREEHDIEPGATLLEMLPDWADPEGKASGVWINNEPIRREDYESMIPMDGDQVDFQRRIHGIELGTLALYTLVSVGVSFVTSLLFAPPDGAREEDSEASPNYGFRGQRNRRSEGHPMEIAFGEFRMAGTVIGEAVDTANASNDTYLRLVLAFGRGPFDAIGGVQNDTSAIPLIGDALPDSLLINGNDARNFDDVEAWIRLGNSFQKPLTGFGDIRQIYSVGASLTSPETSEENVNYTSGALVIDGTAEYDNTNDAYWDEYGVRFDITEENADGFVIRFRFPRGFYTQTGTGALAASQLGFQIRYIALDGNGAPITSGGHAGDGYIRLQPVGPESRRYRTAAEFQVEGVFADPQTYQPFNVSRGISFDGGLGATAVASVAAGHSQATGSDVRNFSASALIQVGTGGLSGSRPVPIIGSINDGNGWALHLTQRQYATGGTVHVLMLTIYRNGVRTTWRVRGGNGDSSAPALGSFYPSNENQWFQVAFRFKSDLVPDFMVNGAYLAAQIDYFEAGGGEFGGNLGAFNIGSFLSWNFFNTQFRFKGRMDSVVVWDRLLTAGELAREWSNGTGTNNHATGAVAIYDFNETTAANKAEGAWWGDVTLGAGCTSGSVNGLVLGDASVDARPGRYRLEVIRTNPTSTSPRVANEVEILDIQSVTTARIAYNSVPILALNMRASEQLNGSTPKVTIVNRGSLCPVWDGLSEAEPTAPKRWTANPAWICAFILTDTDVGLGRYYRLKDLVLPSFQAWADYCDDVVEDGRRSLQLAGDNNASTTDIIFYDSTAVGGPTNPGRRGQLAVLLNKANHNSLPPTWRVGRFIRFTGAPGTADGLATSLNSPRDTGYEIAAITEGATAWRVSLWWDRTDEPDPLPNLVNVGSYIEQQGGGSTWTARLTGGRRRFEFHGVFDQAGDAWGALLKVAAVGRAVPIREGRRIRMKFEIPRSPVGILTSAGFMAGSFRMNYGDPRVNPNALDGLIANVDENYAQTPIRVFSDEILDNRDGTGVRAERKDLFGITDPGQAASQLKFLLNTYDLLRRTATGKLGPDAMQYEPGDVVFIAPDLLERGQSGRALSSSLIYARSMIADGNDLTGPRWVTSGASVAPNTAPDPFGVTAIGRLADASSSITGHVSQKFNRSVSEGLRRGRWCVSLCVRNVNSSVSRIELRDSNGWVAGLMNWTTEEFTLDVRPDTMLGGVRAQRMDDDWWFLTLWIWHEPGDRSVEPELFIQPAFALIGSVNATGTIEVSQVIAQTGQYGAHFVSKRAVILDQPITVDHDEPKSVWIQSSIDNLMRADVDFDLMPEGDYRAGDTLWLDREVVDEIQRGNHYAIASLGELLQMQVVSTRLNEDLVREMDLVEYNQNVFFDYVALEGDEAGGTIGRLRGIDDGTESDNRDDRLPQALTDLQVEDEKLATESGFRNILRLSWGLGGSPDPRDEVRVWVRPFGAKDAWDRLAMVPASSLGCEIELPSEHSETVLEVAAQVVSRAGLAKTVEGSARAAHRFSGLGPLPLPPAEVSAFVAGTRIAVEWQAQRGLGMIGRRGGWVLGDPAFAVRAGTPTTGATEQWARDPFSDGAGALHVASIDQAGQPSPPQAVHVEGEGVATSSGSLSGEGPKRWELHGGDGGWYEGPPFDATSALVQGGLVRQEDGSLGFGEEPDLQGTYLTHGASAIFTTQRKGRPVRRYMPQAVVEASQIHPALMADMDVPAGSRRLDRWTAEGPIYLVAGESECSLRIEMSVLEDDSLSGQWGPWVRYSPAEILCVDVRFRLVATRPDEAFGMRITRFHTALFTVPEPAEATGGSYVHEQVTPASIWTINHNLGRLAPVIVLDSDGYELTCKKQIGLNQTIVSHRSDQTGKAVVG